MEANRRCQGSSQSQIDHLLLCNWLEVERAFFKICLSKKETISKCNKVIIGYKDHSIVKRICIIFFWSDLSLTVCRNSFYLSVRKIWPFIILIYSFYFFRLFTSYACSAIYHQINIFYPPLKFIHENNNSYISMLIMKLK